MRLVKYDKAREALYVQYNTKSVWEYIGITQSDFDTVQINQTEETLKAALKNVLRNSNIVGISRGVIQ